VIDVKDESFFKQLGARLAAARKAQGLTQVQLSERLGIPQQTLARYETGETPVPVAVLLGMAQELRFSLDEVLLGRAFGPGKRGPTSKLERQIDAVRKLPPSKQRFVADMLDAVLAQQTAS
jgi:transcriptional regulator with XRE-family HTH domain